MSTPKAPRPPPRSAAPVIDMVRAAVRLRDNAQRTIRESWDYSVSDVELTRAYERRDRANRFIARRVPSLPYVPNW